MTDKAMRFNTGKPKMSYVMSAKPALEGIARVMEFGAQKYARDNWKRGLEPTSVLDSLLRHVAKYLDGEYLDDESGLPHIDHIACNALFLGYHTDRTTGDGLLDVGPGEEDGPWAGGFAERCSGEHEGCCGGCDNPQVRAECDCPCSE